MSKKQYTRWAITGECGLYTGQYLTRREAIADHVWHLDRPVSRFAGSTLDPGQLKIWRRCQARGDRAVKVSITIQ